MLGLFGHEVKNGSAFIGLDTMTSFYFSIWFSCNVD